MSLLNGIVTSWGLPEPFCAPLLESERRVMGALLEGIEPNDAIVHFPVKIAGKTHDSEGKPYHITVRWGKWDGTKQELVQKVREAIKGLSTKRPKVTEWRPEVFHGKDGDKQFHVLRIPVDTHVRELHDALNAVFGPSDFPHYKAHITVEKDLWQKINDKLLLPGDIGVEVLPLEVAMGNATLQQLGESLTEKKAPKKKAVKKKTKGLIGKPATLKLYRGTADVPPLMQDPLYRGQGIFGDGTYFGLDFDTARTYVDAANQFGMIAEYTGKFSNLVSLDDDDVDGLGLAGATDSITFKESGLEKMGYDYTEHGYNLSAHRLTDELDQVGADAVLLEGMVDGGDQVVVPPRASPSIRLNRFWIHLQNDDLTSELSQKTGAVPDPSGWMEFKPSQDKVVDEYLRSVAWDLYSESLEQLGEAAGPKPIPQKVIEFFSAWDEYSWDAAERMLRNRDLLAWLEQFKPEGQVVLYRGLHIHAEMVDRWKEGGGKTDEGETFQHLEKRHSSWSRHPEVAKKFVFYGEEGETGLVLESSLSPDEIVCDITLIPKSIVLEIPKLSRMFGEQEVIVKPGSHHVRVVYACTSTMPNGKCAEESLSKFSTLDEEMCATVQNYLTNQTAQCGTEDAILESVWSQKQKSVLNPGLTSGSKKPSTPKTINESTLTSLDMTLWLKLVENSGQKYSFKNPKLIQLDWENRDAGRAYRFWLEDEGQQFTVRFAVTAGGLASVTSAVSDIDQYLVLGFAAERGLIESSSLDEAREKLLKINGKEVSAILMAGGYGAKIYGLSDGVAVQKGRKIQVYKDGTPEFKTVMQYVNMPYQNADQKEQIKTDFLKLIEVPIEEGARGNWEKEGITLDDAIKAPTALTVTATAPNGDIAGIAEFERSGNQWEPQSTNVAADHQRKGIATAMYQFVKQKTGEDVVPSQSQTSDAKALWKSMNSPLGEELDVWGIPCATEARDDWAKEGYTIDHKKHGNAIKVVALDSAGAKIGGVSVYPSEDGASLVANDLMVKEEHRRKGIATAMYQYAEKILGKPFQVEPEEGRGRTGDGQKFWGQQNRPFGK